MSTIIDRRPNGKAKSTVNRQRFLKRYKSQLKRAVSDAVNRRSITDIAGGETVGIPSKDVSEPVFQHGPGGRRDMVRPGNKEFEAGDRVQRPDGGRGGSGQGAASNGGVGEDDFVFELRGEEFLDLLFDDLALPRLVRNQLVGTTEFKTVRAGHTSQGNPSNIDVVRSLKGAIARRTVLGAPYRGRIRMLEQELEELVAQGVPETDERVMALREEIERLKARITALPFIDTFDLRYQAFTKQPVPVSRAVMFCIMDVSGSMDQVRKNLAKRFFILMYLFLQRKYDHIDVVFVRHHTVAEEVDEREFFYSRETGGTIVSVALSLVHDIIVERYDPSTWNIYGAQVSDGDNWEEDSQICEGILTKQLLPLLRYFVYVEIDQQGRGRQNLWTAYQRVQAQCAHLATEVVRGPEDIYPVFAELFKA